MNIIDLHCDTAMRLLYENLSLKESICKIDINKLQKGESLAQTFAFFVELNLVKDPLDEFNRMYNNFLNEINKNNGDIQIVRNYDEIIQSKKDGKIGALLSIEEGEVLKGSLDNLKDVYNKGIRLITLTWNFKNSLGYPNKEKSFMNNGLTSKGKEVVEGMEHYKMLPDCSHLSDGGFWDLVDICKKPFIATHSNAREVTSHSRNLTDKMIKALANKGGVMGLNFCNAFLCNKEIPTINDIIKHAKHIRNVGGIDVLALGTDYDGIENEVEIQNIGEIQRLFYALNKEGFSDDEIEKIAYKNVMRIIKDTL